MLEIGPTLDREIEMIGRIWVEAFRLVAVVIVSAIYFTIRAIARKVRT